MREHLYGVLAAPSALRDEGQERAESADIEFEDGSKRLDLGMPLRTIGARSLYGGRGRRAVGVHIQPQ
jgi:hypothetical protein